MESVILTGSGGCVALGGLQPLRAAGFRVIGTDADPRFSPGRYLCDDYHLVPRALVSERLGPNGLEVVPNDDWLNAIGAMLEKTRAVALLVNPDPEVLALAASDQSWPVLFPSRAQIYASHDKRETGRILAEASIELPVWLPSDDETTFAAACRELLDGGFRILAKEQAAAGGQNLHVIDSVDAAVRLRNAHPSLLFYEFLPGDEYAVFLLYRDGELFVEGSFRKHHYKWGQGLRNESMDLDEIFQLGDRAVRALAGAFGDRPHGTYHVDTRRDREGRLKVLEINAARAFGGTPDAYIAYAGDVNLPAVYVELVRGGTPPRQRVPGGIAQLQYHNYVFARGDSYRTWGSMFPSR